MLPSLRGGDAQSEEEVPLYLRSLGVSPTVLRLSRSWRNSPWLAKSKFTDNDNEWTGWWLHRRASSYRKKKCGLVWEPTKYRFYQAWVTVKPVSSAKSCRPKANSGYKDPTPANGSEERTGEMLRAMRC
ncbi:hypothetical protein PIB30_052999 [Stylosanthes scabra]|uniref:Uncharacterized protein n=1 Tax=Stylosanthes scabra TaxID=79078 RepID=A0ABU6XHH1_9FABA|nr:hypothetical protein [Stylosanthes scabra]